MSIMIAKRNTAVRAALFGFFALMALLLSSPAAADNPPKYVFLFIGDGMAVAQINAAEVYLSAVQNPVPPGIPSRIRLSMSRFPVTGLITTFGNNSFVPDSSDAGTALACGRKTNSRVLAMDPAGTVPYKSIAKIAKENGRRIGIVSSVSIDHATPAVFYANQPARDNYYEIAMSMAGSNFDYFGGGGLKSPRGKDGDRPPALEAALANGFQVAAGRTEFEKLAPGRKAIAYNSVLDGEQALYFAMDSKGKDPADHITLAEFTQKGIDLLANPAGFFMMVEGGKIDWACHANDARAVIDDVIAFGEAIEVAVKFLGDHPNDTLIVITADHETGGMSLGAGGSRVTHFELLKGQKESYDEFGRTLAAYLQRVGTPPADIDAEMKELIRDRFGLVYAELSDLEKLELEESYDSSTTGPDRKTPPKYRGPAPFTLALVTILNQRAGVGWTSRSHTGVPVPVFAMGQYAGQFTGFYDNTDIPRKIARAMGMAFPE